MNNRWCAHTRDAGDERPSEISVNLPTRFRSIFTGCLLKWKWAEQDRWARYPQRWLSISTAEPIVEIAPQTTTKVSCTTWHISNWVSYLVQLCELCSCGGFFPQGREIWVLIFLWYQTSPFSLPVEVVRLSQSFDHDVNLERLSDWGYQISQLFWLRWQAYNTGSSTL